MKPIYTVHIVGSGNVAVYLLELLKNNELFVVKQVVARRAEAAQALAQRFGIMASGTLSDLNKTADIYIVAINDDSLEAVNQQLQLPGKLVVHTSGTASVQALGRVSAERGVLWPVYSVRKENLPAAGEVVWAIDGSTETALQTMQLLAGALLGKMVSVLRDEDRRVAHLASVWGNNFANHMMAVAQQLMEARGLSFEVIRPLLLGGLKGLAAQMPMQLQTGPAIRGDRQTMERHGQLMTATPELQQLYEAISLAIAHTHRHES
jgi:predicted short-subunit dehydrogenase-like oxidoreductase (DUF2520 family)